MMSKRGIELLSILIVLASLPACGGDDGAKGEIVPVPSQNWVLAEETPTNPGIHSQGLARLPALGPTDFAFTSRYTIDRTRDGKVAAFNVAFSREIHDLGFDHLGDPDGNGTLVYGGLENDSPPLVNPYHRCFVVYEAETLFIVAWANDQGRSDKPGDGDCPWVAVSPDGNWIVTGEWDLMKTVIVYRVRDLMSDHVIHREGEIPMDLPLRDIQGCDFDGPRVLVCASDDKDAGRPIYAIVLSGPLQGETLPELTAHVEYLFPAPVPEVQCNQPQEVEGDDVDGDTLRVLVIGSCLIDEHLYRYERCKTNCP
jgi:hypothetical protein